MAHNLLSSFFKHCRFTFVFETAKELLSAVKLSQNVKIVQKPFKTVIIQLKLGTQLRPVLFIKKIGNPILPKNILCTLDVH